MPPPVSLLPEVDLLVLDVEVEELFVFDVLVEDAESEGEVGAAGATVVFTTATWVVVAAALAVAEVVGVDELDCVDAALMSGSVPDEVLEEVVLDAKVSAPAVDGLAAPPTIVEP